MRATPTADRAPLWNIRKEKRLATGALNELYIYIYIHTYTREAFLRSFSPGHLHRPPSAVHTTRTYVHTRVQRLLVQESRMLKGRRIIHNNGVYNTLPRAAAIKRLVTRADRRATVTS